MPRALKITISVVEKHTEICSQCQLEMNKDQIIKEKALEYIEDLTGVMYSTSIVDELIISMTDILKHKQLIKD